MYIREKEGFHPFGDEASAHGCQNTCENEEKMMKQEAFDAGYEKAYFGVDKQYNPQFQKEWERGFRSGEAAAMAD
jgi:hypothetical protein